MPSQPQQPLSRELGLSSAFFIVVASMIGNGIFTTSGFIIEKVHHPLLLLLSWFVGGLLALCGALCYGELGTMFPEAGGDYVFLRESFGKKMAFLSGWISLWVGFSAPIAASAVAFGGYFHKILPAHFQNSLSPACLALGALTLLTVVHARGLRLGARMQNLLTFFNLSLILVLIVLGFGSSKGNFLSLRQPFGPQPIFSQGFFSSLILVSFAYTGWNSVAYLGGEIKNPGKNLPTSVIFGTFFVMAIYLLLNLLFVYSLTPVMMSGQKEIGYLAASRLFGAGISTFFSFCISLVLLACLSAMMITGPRVYYAMAKDKVFFPILGQVSAQKKVPAASIYLQFLIAAVLIVSSTFYSLLIYIGAMLTFFSMLTVVGLMLLRRQKPSQARPYRTWGYPVTPVIFIIANGWILCACLKENSSTLLWGLLTIGSGLLLYRFFEKRTVC